MVWKIVRLFCGLAMIATLIALALHFAPAVYSNGDGSKSVMGASWGTVGFLAGLTLALALITVALQALFGVLYDEENDEF